MIYKQTGYQIFNCSSEYQRPFAFQQHLLLFRQSYGLIIMQQWIKWVKYFLGAVSLQQYRSKSLTSTYRATFSFTVTWSYKSACKLAQAARQVGSEKSCHSQQTETVFTSGITHIVVLSFLSWGIQCLPSIYLTCRDQSDQALTNQYILCSSEDTFCLFALLSQLQQGEYSTKKYFSI